MVHGELDPIPAGWSRALAAIIPGAELVVLDGAGHFPMVEDAEPLRAAVVPWILGQGEHTAVSRETTTITG